jgi:hypothetical protein
MLLLKINVLTLESRSFSGLQGKMVVISGPTKVAPDELFSSRIELVRSGNFLIFALAL